jgi:SAM-dependent methyltransferase
MHRNVSNVIRFIMDECIPPVIRDSRLFMYPFFWVAYKGKRVSYMMDFKSHVFSLTDQQYRDLYAGIRSIGTDRPTSLNTRCLKRILESCGGEPKRILDVGSGSGYLVRLLESQGHEVWGTDIHEPAASTFSNYRRSFAEQLPFEDQGFDVVISTHTLEHIRDPKRALSELKRVSRGKIIIVVPRQRPFYYTLDEHVNFYPHPYSLPREVGEAACICESLHGDWYYEADLLRPYNPR